ncbi:MAG TPA: YjbQ family protein [Candidatus Krumholzibacteria bacterium]|nr:YjbQ family protein [Candidatus Krumholzibacteria bacterium]
MRIETTRLHFSTADGASLADVTAEVNGFVRDAAVYAGLCILTLPGEGCCLTLSAELDDDVDDLLRIVRTHLAHRDTGGPGEPLAPPSIDRLDVDDSGYPAGGVIADSITVSIRDGAIHVGTWEAVVLLDACGPRAVALDVTLIGT